MSAKKKPAAPEPEGRSKNRLWAILASVGAAFLALFGALLAWKLTTRDRCGLPGIEEFNPERLPIYLIISGELPGRRWTRATSWAVDLWNQALGDQVFTMNLVPGGSTVAIQPFPEWEDPGTAFAKVNLGLTDTGKGISTAGIYVDPIAAEAVDDVVLNRAMAHEMGHVLGLAHDEIPSSLMYEKALPDEPTITQNDIDFLRRVYELA